MEGRTDDDDDEDEDESTEYLSDASSSAEWFDVCEDDDSATARRKRRKRWKTYTPPPRWGYPLILVAVVVLYMMSGALLFMFIENHQNSNDECTDCDDQLDLFLRHLWRASRVMEEHDWRTNAHSQLQKWQELLRSVGQDEASPRPRQQREHPLTLLESVNCIFSVLTTIGWGNIAPVSMGGKMFIVFYSWLGIPLMLLLMAEIGAAVRVVACFVSRLWWWIYDLFCSCAKGRRAKAGRPHQAAARRPCCAQCETKGGHEPDGAADDGDAPVCSIWLLLFLYFLVGVIVLSLYVSGWSKLDAFYYTYTGFSSIGFGDIVYPIDKTTVLAYVYLVVGMVLLAFTFQTIQDVFAEHLQNLTALIFGKLCFAWRRKVMDDAVDGVPSPLRFRQIVLCRPARRRRSYPDPRCAPRQRGLMLNIP